MRVFIRGFMNFYRLLRYKIQTFYICTDQKTILFGSFGGESYSDNPKAIFEYMIASGEFDDYTFVWGFKKGIRAKRRLIQKVRSRLRPEEFAEIDKKIREAQHQLDQNPNDEKTLGLVEKYKEQKNHIGPDVVVVKFGGKKWRKYTAKAGCWILNYKVDDYLKPKKNQVFLQTWHGTPLKRLGNDLIHFDNVLNTKEGMKKRYTTEAHKFDYFISPSPFASEKFKSAWRMDDCRKGDIMLEEGYPRNDILFNYTDQMIEEIKIQIFGYYFIPYEKFVKKKTIILYAPTYRSNQHQTGVGYVYREEVDFDKMQAVLGEDYIILFRAHYFIANKFDFEKYRGFVWNVSKVNDINDLYLISDLLVTDYSSSMFDYANLKRPMIYYMYDLEHYRDESNGFYFDPAQVLPGPIVKTDDELIAAIQDVNENFEYDEKYQAFNERFDPWDDGHASERVVNEIFGKAGKNR